MASLKAVQVLDQNRILLPAQAQAPVQNLRRVGAQAQVRVLAPNLKVVRALVLVGVRV